MAGGAVSTQHTLLATESAWARAGVPPAWAVSGGSALGGAVQPLAAI